MSLVLEGLGFADGPDTHIDNVSMTLARGKLHVLLGPTLAGKTTLMRLMAGLDKPSSGRLLLDGRDITGLPVRKRSVAMVYQQFVNYPTLTVYENIASPLRVAGLPRDEIKRRVAHAAKLLRLEPMLDRLPAQLSGGQQQRTAIARALVKRAELVLLDEPLGNLDYKLREELREELPPLFAESGAILVYATTEPTEALLLGGETAALSQGRLVQFGRTADLYRRPATLEAARVFSDPPLNELAIERRGGMLITALGQSPLPPALAGVPDGRYVMAFRADAVSLGAPAADAMAFDGRISVSEINGSESFVHVVVGDATWVCLVPGVYDGQVGAPVGPTIDLDQVFLFDTNGAVVARTMMAEAV
ncbi:MAG: ABC transporter ATP-binding protein [Oxalobacteraceae bacterium]|nr:MAG: ABC transporter ATP-binding protein [Oxalobacteraceae bacterium]